jgi:hypothetical protein
MVQMKIKQLREPSTFAGLSALALLFGASVEEATAAAQVIAAIAGAAAVFMPERKSADDAEPRS